MFTVKDMKRRSKAQPSTMVDGVAQRQRRRTLGDFDDRSRVLSSDAFSRSEDLKNKQVSQALLSKQADLTEVETITQEDIIENTRSDIDSPRLSVKGWRSRRKAKRLAKKQRLAKRSRRYRIARRIVRGAGVALFLIGGWYAITSLGALSNIIDRGGEGALALQDNIQPSQLKGEGDGRINILLIGIGGDSHVAGDLADSIMIASIDPFAHELAMLSVPRDLYVDVPGYYSTKINAAHAIGEESQPDDGGGIALLQDTIETTFAINIHYYVRVDFQGFKQAIDTVGGVTINLEEPVYDPNFDWEFGTNALNLPAGDVTLDGQTALLLSRARGASGVGIGVERGDFGRSDRQRKILLALKKKVFSIGTFGNPVKMSALIKNAGDHGRTNLQIGEMLALYDILDKIPDDKIISFGLDNNPDNYLVSDSIDGASVLIPKSGSYEEIQLFLRELFVDGFIRTESPVVDVYNGTAQGGLGSETAADLETYGYKIGIVDNADKQTYANSVAYDLTNDGKPYTKALLQNRFKLTMKPGSELPAAFKNTQSDFVIIVGSNHVQEDSSY